MNHEKISLGNVEGILKSDHSRKRQESLMKLKKITDKMNNTYCPLNGSNCINNCTHFQHGSIVDDNLSVDVYEVIKPVCKLWRNES